MRRQKKSEMGKTKMECKKLDTLTETQKCAFCHTSDMDEMKYGPIYMSRNIITHYYCLLLSSNMEQNGRDCDGILGFLPSDITKEIKRGSRLYCSFCRSGGATLGCAISKCKVVFHLPCGMKHGTLHQFFGEFKSYCAKHRPVQRISEKILAESSKGAMCGICYDKVVPRPIHETLWAPCCQKSAFFHRDCVQKLATSAGYFFKCPLCNNTNTFQQSMKEFGIYIPEQDASWECVPHAYQDLLVRHDSCDSEKCICPSGRKTNIQGTRWELILCKYCGSQGIHIGCGRLKWRCPEFQCDICSSTSAAETQDRGNTRNYNGNRHRLSGVGRTADIHPSVSADREDKASDNESDDSGTFTITNRKKKVVSPIPAEEKGKSPRPDKKHKSSEKKSVTTTIVHTTTTVISEERRSKATSRAILIEDSDSDEDVEVVSETKGSNCLQAFGGSKIPIVQVNSRSEQKRLRALGDPEVVPEEIVDITTCHYNWPGPAKKPKPTSPPPIKEIPYSLPPKPPQPSTSFSVPSTSYTPAELGSFVLVDPKNFRPEDLPPGTVLYRSVQPVLQPVPPQTQFQPQVQQPQLQPQMPQLQPQSQIPVSNMSMQQLGPASHADAKHSDLGEHRPGSCYDLNPQQLQGCCTKEAPRAIKHHSTGRRRGRPRRNNNRLKPQVVLSPLKCRISNDGHFEILLPRRNLGFGSLKRKASPLPSRPAKKLKISVTNKKFLTKPKNNKKPSFSLVSDSTKIKMKKKLGKNNDLNVNKSNSKNKLNNKLLITKFFCPENLTREPNKKEVNKRKRTKKIVKDEHVGKVIKPLKEKSPGSKMNAKKKDLKRTVKLFEEWKFKKIDEYLRLMNEKSQVKLDPEGKDNESTIYSSFDHSSKMSTVQDLIDEMIELAVESSEESNTSGACDMSEESLQNSVELCNDSHSKDSTNVSLSLDNNSESNSSDVDSGLDSLMAAKQEQNNILIDEISNNKPNTTKAILDKHSESNSSDVDSGLDSLMGDTQEKNDVLGEHLESETQVRENVDTKENTVNSQDQASVEGVTERDDLVDKVNVSEEIKSPLEIISEEPEDQIIEMHIPEKTNDCVKNSFYQNDSSHKENVINEAVNISPLKTSSNQSKQLNSAGKPLISFFPKIKFSSSAKIKLKRCKLRDKKPLQKVNNIKTKHSPIEKLKKRSNKPKIDVSKSIKIRSQAIGNILKNSSSINDYFRTVRKKESDVDSGKNDEDIQPSSIMVDGESGDKSDSPEKRPLAELQQNVISNVG